MSVPTVPAFIHTGNWDAQTCAHPAMAWMESYTRTAVDNRSWTIGTLASEWHAADFTLQKVDGTVIRGGEAAWHEGIAVIYGPFTAHLHSPNFLVCSQTEDGWQMIGQADLYASLPSERCGGRVRDGERREWDIKVPSAFWFEYVRDEGAKHGGILLRSTKIFGDTAPVMKAMVQRGMVTKEDLGF